MANAGLDQNGRPTLIAASKADGTTIVPIYAVASAHTLVVDDDGPVPDNGNNSGNAMPDQNSRVVAIALSSANDGTIIELYGDPLTNALLIKST